MLREFFRACLIFAQPYFENCFRGYFLVVVRSVAGYVTEHNRKIDRKETQKRLNKNLIEEKLALKDQKNNACEKQDKASTL